MVSSDPAGTNWTDAENDLIVADYFDMLAKELGGEPPSKTQHRQELERLTRRSHGSIEYKHRNISAVLQKLGSPWVVGYKPLHNYQNSLMAGIDRYLSSMGVPVSAPSMPQPRAAEPKTLYLEPAPALNRIVEPETPELRHLVSKFDPAARDARNRSLGRRGEELVLEFEKDRLRTAGRDDLASKVDWVSETLGDGAGYDILSFTERGEPRLLEVKTTEGYERTPFFLSANECALSEKQPTIFRIFRLYNFVREPKAFQITPPLKESLYLRAANYRASFS